MEFCKLLARFIQRKVIICSMEFKEYSKNHIVLLDGAMGTYFNQLHPGEGEAEEANTLHPDWIVDIHRQYIEAGAQLIRTNTFAVNHTLFPKPEQRQAQIRAAVANGRKAVEESGKNVFLGASIGPIRQEMGQSQEDVLEEYEMLVDVFLEENVTLFVLETFAETKWVKLLAERIREKRQDSFILAEFSVNPSGYTKFGYSMQQIVNEFAVLSREREVSSEQTLDAFGFNCGVDAVHLNRLLEKLVFPCECCFSALPNAGYQHELRGRLRYSDNPPYYAKQMQGVAAQGVNLLGGCCGTTPEHIRALHKMLCQMEKQSPQKKFPYNKRIAVSTIPHKEIQEANPFMEKLTRGEEKVYVVELDSPFGPDAEKFQQGAFLLRENNIDMITVSDSPMARARADAALMAQYIQDKVDVAVMPHIACRDRNLIGLRSEILGAYINGSRNFLVITGDPVAKEDRNAITGVFDVNSIRLMEYIKNMNEELFAQAPVYYGGALNYDGVNVDAIVRRMEQKIEAGCSYFLTQPIFSKEDIERIRLLKARVDTKIICGIMPLVSYKNALFMHNEMPGIHVSDEVLAQYRPDMSREEAEKVALRVSLEIAEQLYDVADGFYIMTPFQRVGLVNQIICAIRKLG